MTDHRPACPARPRREEGRQRRRPWPPCSAPTRPRSPPRSTPPWRPGRAAGAKGTFMVAPAGREWLDEQYPEVYADFRADPGRDRGLRALRADQPRAARALHRLADDPRRPAASGSPTTTPTPTTTPASSTASAPSTSAPRRCSTASPSSTRGSASTKTRLDEAYDKVLAGEHDWVSGARIDSYHTVWFELHEDLLRMLGREREEAP